MEIDRLIEVGKIKEEVFAQIGYSDYRPKNYKSKEFLDREEFSTIMKKCNKVITHGGTGAIIGAVKNKKKVIAVPRLSEFGEHVDDHQLQITSEFSKMNFIYTVIDIRNLETALLQIENTTFKKYESNTITIINDIEDYIMRYI